MAAATEDPRIQQEVRDVTRIERIGAHSHIRGLGLDDALEARFMSHDEALDALSWDKTRQALEASRAVLRAAPPRFVPSARVVLAPVSKTISVEVIVERPSGKVTRIFQGSVGR